MEWINKVCCFDCGFPYLTEKQKESGGNVVTFHEGVCCLCGKTKSVTDTRHYNYLNPVNNPEQLKEVGKYNKLHSDKKTDQ